MNQSKHPVRYHQDRTARQRVLTESRIRGLKTLVDERPGIGLQEAYAELLLRYGREGTWPSWAALQAVATDGSGRLRKAGIHYEWGSAGKRARFWPVTDSEAAKAAV